MAGWQAFGGLAAGNQPLSLFDTLSGQIAQTVIVPTTASGTNAILLALNANAPTIVSYNNFQQFSFVAANNSTGAVTVNVNSIGVVNLYKPGNIAAGSGDISSGVLYVIAFNQALNAGLGGFQIVSATPASLSLPVTVTNGGTGLTSLTTFAPLCGGTGSTANVQQATTGFSTVGAVLTSQGNAALPTWVAGSAASGSLVSIQAFTASQTVTIPATATKLYVVLVGAGGGAQTGQAAGAGGTAISYLTGLTPGNTLVLTVGAGGTTAGTAGGNSSLASGSQTISTITANGGAAGNSNNSAGGTASGGNLANITAGGGVYATFVTGVGSPCTPPSTGSFAIGGDSAVATTAKGNTSSPGFGSASGSGFNAGTFTAGGASAGSVGGAYMWWFT